MTCAYLNGKKLLPECIASILPCYSAPVLKITSYGQVKIKGLLILLLVLLVINLSPVLICHLKTKYRQLVLKQKPAPFPSEKAK